MRFKDWLKESDEAMVGKTTENNGHYHMYKVNFFGRGQTTETVGGDEHIHDIYAWKIDMTHDHKHEMNTHSDNHNDKKSGSSGWG